MARNSKKIVGDICLYGTSRTGAGFLVCAAPHGQTGGTGEPVAGRSFSEAVWMGVEMLEKIGVGRGLVRIFAPGGEEMAVVELGGLVPAYGSLKWGPAVTYEINAAELIGAAQ